MKTTVSDPLKALLQLVIVALAYAVLAVVMLGAAEGAWRIPAVFVMVFFLPVLASSCMQFYWQLCRPAWRRLLHSA